MIKRDTFCKVLRHIAVAQERQIMAEIELADLLGVDINKIRLKPEYDQAERVIALLTEAFDDDNLVAYWVYDCRCGKDECVPFEVEVKLRCRQESVVFRIENEEDVYDCLCFRLTQKNDCNCEGLKRSTPVNRATNHYECQAIRR